MLNYIKSECYRISHQPTLYVTTGILCLLSISVIAFLAVFNWKAYDFDLAYTGFAYSWPISAPSLYLFMAAIIPASIYSCVHKYGDVKNTVAGGLSRVQIFAGKCITSLLAATIVMIIVLAVWIASTELLLEPGGPFTARDLLLEVPAVYLIAAANVITVQLFYELFKRELLVAFAWAAIWLILPTVLFSFGIQFDVLANIANWMPYQFLKNAVEIQTITGGKLLNSAWQITVAEQVGSVLWYTRDGLFKCLLSGTIGVAVFSFSGWLLLRHRDL